jgi:adenylate cyclase
MARATTGKSRFKAALRLIDLGVNDGNPAAEVRRIRLINLVSVSAIVVTVGYAILFAASVGSTLSGLFRSGGMGGLTSPIVVNLFATAGYAVPPFLNRSGRHHTAFFFLLLVTLAHLTTTAMMLGLGTGIFLFLFIVPVVGTLFAPAEIPVAKWVAVVAGIAAPVVVVSLRPPVPEPIAGTWIETTLLVTSVISTLAFATGVGLYFRRLVERAESDLQKAHELTEQLLLNVLPPQIAERLKAGEQVIADRREEVSILFADLVGSTALADRLSADELVGLLNQVFTPFDDLAEELGLEKIKTVGDAYMVVGGLPVPRVDHLEAVVEMALRMREEISRHVVEGHGQLQMRFGIHTGAVVAGVIGKRKFSYDLWGDTVNVAARMEAHGIPDEIQVTAEARRRLDGRYRFEARGPVEVKGKGVMETYLLKSR